MSAIYEPAGAAKEYSQLACNLYRGCTHGCKYCYAPACLRMNAQDFHAGSQARKDILRQIEKDAARLAGDPREVLFCFTSDPYQPNEDGTTRRALEIMERNSMRCQVLTKGGMRASRDFDLLARNGWKFGTTLLFSSESSATVWEPGAAKIESRIAAIKSAHEKGIETWVSVEPVIDPRQALEVIEGLLPYVDYWKIGKLNHMKAVESGVDWRGFLRDVEALLDGRPHLIKDALEAFR
jgi:DNA repair photolyase